MSRMIAFPRPHTARIRSRRAVRGDAGGLTLVELMIAMMLGLLVTVSASAIFISNRQTYRATEGLGRVQENGRMAFELMARDLREAGGNPCGNADRKEPLKLVNVLNNPNNQWWSAWNNGVIGYEAVMPTPPANRVAGTDAIALMSGDNSTGVTVVQHNPNSAQFQLNTVNHSLDDSDIAIVCDWRQASLFQVTNAQPGTNEVIVHNTGNTASPGNCSKGLGYANPPNCSVNGTPYEYGPNSMIVRLHAVRWYVGTTPGGGRSLFRSTLVNDAGALQARDQQIAEGVNNMQLQYLLEDGTAYVDATAVAADRWDDVVAVRVTLDLLSADRAGVGGAQLARRLAHTVTLRNRME
jgi:type IV pilus assembly protein PilW